MYENTDELEPLLVDTGVRETEKTCPLVVDARFHPTLKPEHKLGTKIADVAVP